MTTLVSNKTGVSKNVMFLYMQYVLVGILLLTVGYLFNLGNSYISVHEEALNVYAHIGHVQPRTESTLEEGLMNQYLRCYNPRAIEHMSSKNFYIMDGFEFNLKKSAVEKDANTLKEMCIERMDNDLKQMISEPVLLDKFINKIK